jgi:hypothetical protein
MAESDVDPLKRGVWRPRAPAPEAAVKWLVLESPMEFPDEYIDLLRESNGGYAELSSAPWTVDL